KASAPDSFVRPFAGVGVRKTNQGKVAYLGFHSVIGTTILSRSRPMAFSLTTTAMRTFLISSPSAGSNRIRHTSPLTGFVVIDFFLGEGLKAGKLLVVAVVFFRQQCGRRQDRLARFTRHHPQLRRR